MSADSTRAIVPPYSEAIVQDRSPAAHALRGIGHRLAKFAGPAAVAAYDRTMYPARVERPAMEAIRHIDTAVADSSRPAPTKPRVVHIIGSLAAGGAERQLATYVAAAHARGLATHSVVTFSPSVGEAAHFRPVLEAAGVSVRALGDAASSTALTRVRTDAALRSRLLAIPPELGIEAMECAGEILAADADIVHAWLDHTNIVGGIAGLAAGAPRVILSLRSLSPPHFPAWHRPWMLPWYQALATSLRVRIAANSKMGALDYAQWMGVESSRIEVVHNGLDPAQFAATDAVSVARLRTELGATGRRLVVGVFRIGDEKMPHHFAHIARRVLRELPDTLFVIAGDGPMREELARATEDLGASFQLLGRRSDVATLFAAAQATLLCSRVEGLPNVLIEAQFLGCPVVATDAGGAPETFVDGATGFLHPIGAVSAMADSLVRLLRDDSLHAKFSAEARAFATDRFGLDAVVRSTHALYA